MAMDATNSVTPGVVALVLANPLPDSTADVPKIVVQVVDLKPNGTCFTYAITKAICIAFVMTFLVFDVPFFWPILLCYWIVLFVLTMKRQILHMIKYKYVPFNLGKQSELEIEPRYPLFGGWRCTFTIGYGLPLQDFVFESDDGRRYINLTFGCPLLDTVGDDLTIKVVLPEGSKSPQAIVPFLIEQHIETSYSYLDVVGRTTVVLKKKNVVGEHNVPFQVYYEFNPIFMLAEPLMLILAVFLFFVACIAYLHMDLSIGKS